MPWEPDPQNLEIADRARIELERFDGLHPAIKRAYIECPFGLVVPVHTLGLNVDAMVARIRAVRSFADQREFNQTFGRC